MHCPSLEPRKSQSKVGLPYAGQCLASHTLFARLVGTAGIGLGSAPAPPSDGQVRKQAQRSKAVPKDTQIKCGKTWTLTRLSAAAPRAGPKNAQVPGLHQPGSNPSPTPYKLRGLDESLDVCKPPLKQGPYYLLDAALRGCPEGPSQCAPD